MYNILINYILYNLILSTPKHIINIITDINRSKTNNDKIIKQLILKYIYNTSNIINNKRIILRFRTLTLNGSLIDKIYNMCTVSIKINVNGKLRIKYVIGRYIDDEFKPLEGEYYAILHSSYNKWVNKDILDIWENDYNVPCTKNKNTLFSYFHKDYFKIAVIHSTKNRIDMLMEIEALKIFNDNLENLKNKTVHIKSQLNKENILTTRIEEEFPDTH